MRLGYEREERAREQGCITEAFFYVAVFTIGAYVLWLLDRC